MNKEQVIESLREHRLIFFIRAINAEHVSELVECIWRAGGRFVEVTLNTPGGLQALESLARRIPAGCFLGAGTLLKQGDVDGVVQAGVQFVVTPAATPELVARIREAGLMGIIGASTPTEILNAHSWGADFVKVFPAQSPEYIKAVRAPLSHIPLVAVGGVMKDNAIKYLKAGCAAVAVGSSCLSVERDGSFNADEASAMVRALVRVCALGGQVDSHAAEVHDARR